MTAPATRMPAVTRGVLWMLASSFFYALTYITVRELSHGFSVFEVSFFRAVVATIVMLPWLVRAGPGALRTTRIRLYGFRAVFTYSGMVCWFYGLANLPLADATALIFTAPFFAVLILSVAIGETVGPRRWIAIAVGFLGAMIIVRPGFAEISLATAAVMYTSIAYGGSNASTRALAITENPNAVVFYMFALVVPISALPAAFYWTWPHWSDAPMIVAFGVLSLVSMTCLTRSLAHAPAAIVMPIFYLQLPFVAILAYVRYGEAPGPFIWFGGVIICAAGYYIARSETRRAGQGTRRAS